MTTLTYPSPAAAKDVISAYSFGIEEEYFLTRLDKRDTCQTMPAAFVQSCRKELPGVFELEMLQSQVEVATPPHFDMSVAKTALASYRARLHEIGARYNLGIAACGTHPKALWSRQRATDKARYAAVMDELQMLGQRNLVCGMHVHVALPDPGKRIDIMTRITPFLPLLMALSTSSPFWNGKLTGLMGYRYASYDELPRTGLPVIFDGTADYAHYIETMTAARAIKDASYIWWAIRPSLKYPTLELRITDSCTFVDDAIAIAGLYRCLIRRLDRDPAINDGLTAASGAIALENKWRAQRYGIQMSFIDEQRKQAVPFKDAIEDLIELVWQDAEELGCLHEVLSVREILNRGTSAERQVHLYHEARKTGWTKQQALDAVVDWLVKTSAGEPGTAPHV